MIITFDDTDSPQGMCTTFLAPMITKVIHPMVLASPPALVRLNPNIPWKTRGNGAVVLEIGTKKGNGTPLGEWEEERIEVHPDAKKDVVIPWEIVEKIKNVVMSNALTECDNTNPGLIFLDKRPDSSWYQKGVKSVVDKNDVLRQLNNADSDYFFHGNGRGLIGAYCASAWPEEDRTYEVIAYRKKENIGTKRELNGKEVRLLDNRFPMTFNNYDEKNDHVAILPNTDCPVLYGVRGDNPRELMNVPDFLTSEEKRGWVLFRSNQGTGDHLAKGKVTGFQEHHSYVIRGKITSEPMDVEGGHVVITFADHDAEIPLMAYEPTKEFRDVIRALAPGDDVTVSGSFRNEPRGLNLEKVTVHQLADIKEKRNPPCPQCGKNMKSMGKEQGYRCRECKEYAKNPLEISEPRTLVPDSYEVPICARRHLHRPLKRDKKLNEKT